jgi:hypothetical protein
VNTKVVPEPSERRTTTIGCDGSFAPGLSLRSAAWFHDLISPRKMRARVGPSSVMSPLLNTFDVHHRDDAAYHGRELHEPMRVQVRGIERHVGGAEGHLLVVDLPDALARPDRLIGDADTGLLFVGVGPFRVDRKRKGGAGAGNLGASGWGDGGRGDGGRGDAPGGREHLQEASGHEDRGIRVGKTSAGMRPGNRPIAECPRRPCKRCYGCMIIS